MNLTNFNLFTAWPVDLAMEWSMV